MGEGLEGVLLNRKNDLYGILNGINYNEFNPADDAFLYYAYDERNLSGKI